MVKKKIRKKGLYGGLTREERTNQRRQQFIDAGIELFGTRGFNAVTVRNLCAQTGLTVRYYYESFSSNEDILIAAFDQCFRRIQHHIVTVSNQADANADPRLVIPEILDAVMMELEDKRVARILMLEVLGVSDAVDQFCNERMESLGRLILRLGHNLYPAWEIEDEQGVLLGVSVLGAIRQATIHWMVNDYKIDRKQIVQATSLLVIGLLHVIEEQSNEST